MPLTICPLPKDEYAGYSYTATYTTNRYYDVDLLKNGFQLIGKEADEALEKEFSDSLFADWLEEPIAYGAFEDKKLLGFIEGSKESWHNVFRISNVFVYAEYRRRGIGEALLSDMIQRVKREQRYRGIILETQTCNFAAISLYTKLGFTLTRIDLREYSNRDIENKEVRIDLFLEL